MLRQLELNLQRILNDDTFGCPIGIRQRMARTRQRGKKVGYLGAGALGGLGNPVKTGPFKFYRH